MLSATEITIEERLEQIEKDIEKIKRSLSIEEEEFCDQISGEHTYKPGKDFCLCGKDYGKGKR